MVLDQFVLQFSSVAQSCPTLCDPMDCSTPGFPVHHQLPELAQTHVHRVNDAQKIICPYLLSKSQIYKCKAAYIIPLLFLMAVDCAVMCRFQLCYCRLFSFIFISLARVLSIMLTFLKIFCLAIFYIFLFSIWLFLLLCSLFPSLCLLLASLVLNFLFFFRELEMRLLIGHFLFPA